MHLTSLPGPYGIGEIGAAARAFVDKMVRMELSVWQFLPLGPTAYGDSPYQPLSTFAGNEMLVDIGDLIDLGLLSEDPVTYPAGMTLSQWTRTFLTVPATANRLSRSPSKSRRRRLACENGFWR